METEDYLEADGVLFPVVMGLCFELNYFRNRWLTESFSVFDRSLHVGPATSPLVLLAACDKSRDKNFSAELVAIQY